MIRLRALRYGATGPSLRVARFGATGVKIMWGSASALRRGCTTFVRTLTILAAVMIGGSSRLLACPVCFGAEEGSIIDGTRVGILVLLAITFVVQGGFLGFFFYLRRRARLNRDEDLEAEWAELQRASRTS